MGDGKKIRTRNNLNISENIKEARLGWLGRVRNESMEDGSEWTSRYLPIFRCLHTSNWGEAMFVILYESMEDGSQ